MVPSPQRSTVSPSTRSPSSAACDQLISEARLAAILSQTGRASERRRRLPAESVIWLVIAMALFAADSIPKVWRRLHPGRDEPEPTDSAFTQARNGSASRRSGTSSSRSPAPWPPTRPGGPSTAAGG